MAKYCWEDGHPAIIEAHSIKKHEVLREYLIQYIKIVGGENFFQKKLILTLIDGFAGGGLYVKESDGTLHEGSPLIFLRATEEGAFLVSQEKEFTLNAHYLFVEKDLKVFSFLRDTLIKKGFERRIGQDILLINGAFEERIQEIIMHIKSRGRAGRCIFLLDQYGYSDVNLSLLRDIFINLPHAEIILTFAVDFLIDYMTGSEECQQRLNDIGFSLNIANLTEEKAQKRWRFMIQHKLYQDIIKTGALFYTSFFIKSRESHRSYWLLHLSMHPKAKDEMQNLHWNFKNAFVHEGKPGLCMLGYDPKNDNDITQQPFLFNDYDRDLSHRTLLEQVPQLLTTEGIQVYDFYKAHCNQTPATFDMIKKILRELCSMNELEARTQYGNRKRRESQIQANDIIQRKLQLTLF